jgi:uncharacterized membrane protein
MEGHIALLAASTTFVGTHFVLSHPLRAPLVERLGEKGFTGLYALVAIASLTWMVIAYRAIAIGPGLWAANDVIWIIATIAMWIAAMLFVGSFAGNPALPAPGAKKAANQVPSGVFKITRHPMMWSFAIWGAVHILIAPRLDNLILCGAIIILALVGARFQDDKKFVQMGDAWLQWRSRTSFVPFAKGVVFPGWLAVFAGTALWLFASYAHIPAQVGNAGVFRWI